MKSTRIAICPYCRFRNVIPRRGYMRGVPNHMGSSFKCQSETCGCTFKTR